MDDRLVPDRDVAADHGGEPAELRVRSVVADMHHGAVLQVGARADADEVDVAAEDSAGPDGGVVAEHDIADDGGGGIDVDAFAEDGELVAVGAQGHGAHLSRHTLRA